MAYIEWDYTVITSMVEKQGWNLPDRSSEEWYKFNDGEVDEIKISN